MTKNRTPTPVYLDPGMHPGLEVKGLNMLKTEMAIIFTYLENDKIPFYLLQIYIQLITFSHNQDLYTTLYILPIGAYNI